MNNSFAIKLLIGLGVFLFIFLQSIFVVHQTEQAIVLQLGNPKKVEYEAGLKFKIPFIQNVVFLDNRLLNLDPPAEEVPLIDQKRIIVDSYMRYKIVDPLLFYQTVREQRGFRSRFTGFLLSAVREELGRSTIIDLLGQSRTDSMNNIQKKLIEQGNQFGVQVIDMRIGRTDLPERTRNSVFDRMRSSREAEARKLRAEGNEIKIRIEAEADKEAQVILAQARQTAQIALGIGESERNNILNIAYSKSLDLFKLFKNLEAYDTSLSSDDTTLILSTDNDFFKLLQKDNR